MEKDSALRIRPRNLAILAGEFHAKRINHNHVRAYLAIADGARSREATLKRIRFVLPRSQKPAKILKDLEAIGLTKPFHNLDEGGMHDNICHAKKPAFTKAAIKYIKNIFPERIPAVRYVRITQCQKDAIYRTRSKGIIAWIFGLQFRMLEIRQFTARLKQRDLCSASGLNRKTLSRNMRKLRELGIYEKGISGTGPQRIITEYHATIHRGSLYADLSTCTPSHWQPWYFNLRNKIRLAKSLGLPFHAFLESVPSKLCSFLNQKAKVMSSVRSSLRTRYFCAVQAQASP